jgi:hypothetical protein
MKKISVLISLALLSMTSLVNAAEPEVEEGVLVLTDDNFDE